MGGVGVLTVINSPDDKKSLAGVVSARDLLEFVLRKRIEGHELIYSVRKALPRSDGENFGVFLPDSAPALVQAGRIVVPIGRDTRAGMKLGS